MGRKIVGPVVMLVVGLGLMLGAFWGGAWVMRDCPRWQEVPVFVTAYIAFAVGLFCVLGGVVLAGMRAAKP